MLLKKYHRQKLITLIKSKRFIYLPHRLVIKDDRVTSKVRIVFDNSSKIKEPPLNDCVNPGPFLTEPLLSVVSCFRANKIVFAADI